MTHDGHAGCIIFIYIYKPKYIYHSNVHYVKAHSKHNTLGHGRWKKAKSRFAAENQGLLSCERKVQQKYSMSPDYLCRSANTEKSGGVQRTSTEM